MPAGRTGYDENMMIVVICCITLDLLQSSKQSSQKAVQYTVLDILRDIVRYISWCKRPHNILHNVQNYFSSQVLTRFANIFFWPRVLCY